jgi:hypothetical protein
VIEDLFGVFGREMGEIGNVRFAVMPQQWRDTPEKKRKVAVSECSGCTKLHFGRKSMAFHDKDDLKTKIDGIEMNWQIEMVGVEQYEQKDKKGTCFIKKNDLLCLETTADPYKINVGCPYNVMR